ncbi:response regulator transcription factor [Anaerolineales bacterium]
MTRILIIEDDKDLCRILRLQLQHHGYEIAEARDGLEGFLTFQQWNPDVVMLDIALPKMDGWTVCQRIRAQSDAPILMMTAHAVTEQDIARGLDMGADEYMLKPLGKIELHSRIKALLRRAKYSSFEENEVTQYQDNYLSVDVPLRQVVIDGNMTKLTPTEFKLLETFIRHPGKVLSFERLLEEVWGVEYRDEHHYPRIYVSHLRRKIEPDIKNPTYIQNEYGIGYRFVGSVT